MSHDESEALFPNALAALRWALSDELLALQQVSTYRKPGAGRGLSGFDGAAQAGMILAQVRELKSPLYDIVIAQAAPVKLPCKCGRKCCSGWRINERWESAVEHIAHWWHLEFDDCQRPRLVMGCLRRFFNENVSIDTLAKRAGLHRATVSEFNGLVVKPLKPLKEAAWRELEEKLAIARIAGAPPAQEVAAA